MHDRVQDEAVIDLMVLVSLADRVSEVEERDRINAFVDGRDWPAAHNAATYVLQATTRARDALNDQELLGTFLESIMHRLHDADLRLFAVEVAEQVAAADGTDDRLERLIVQDIRHRLGF